MPHPCDKDNMGQNWVKVEVASLVINKGVSIMAKNTGDNYRKGAVTGRTQFERPDGHFQKRDERTGHFMEVKTSSGPFKGVAKEPDGRDTDKS